jgi:hypothetical protein
MADIIYPPQGDSVPTYATFAAFPATAADGSLAVALDTDVLYTYNGNGGVWVPVGSNVGPSSAYYVNEFTLDATDISNKFVTLTATPANPSLAVLEVIGGPTQRYGSDFSISGSQLTWNSLFLDGVLEVGDQLIVQFY